jgi:hypothetical protein
MNDQDLLDDDDKIYCVLMKDLLCDERKIYCMLMIRFKIQYWGFVTSCCFYPTPGYILFMCNVYKIYVQKR